jgi:hypothetical protein
MLISKVENPGGEYAPAVMTGVFVPFWPVTNGGGGAYHEAHRRRSPEMDRRIANHEAGHVVAGRALGQLIGGSTIEPGENYSGATWGPNSDPSSFFTSEETIATCATLSTLMPAFGEPRDDVAIYLVQTHGRVIELLAGTEAERLLFTAAPPLEAPHDIAEARAHAALICCSPAAVEAFLIYASTEARELIRLHRHLVQVIADALIERRTLDGTEIDVIVADASAREALRVEQERRTALKQAATTAATFRMTSLSARYWTGLGDGRMLAVADDPLAKISPLGFRTTPMEEHRA